MFYYHNYYLLPQDLMLFGTVWIFFFNLITPSHYGIKTNKKKIKMYLKFEMRVAGGF